MGTVSLSCREEFLRIDKIHRDPKSSYGNFFSTRSSQLPESTEGTQRLSSKSSASVSQSEIQAKQHQRQEREIQRGRSEVGT
jgi:hypothetical protein